MISKPCIFSNCKTPYANSSVERNQHRSALHDAFYINVLKKGCLKSAQCLQEPQSIYSSDLLSSRTTIALGLSPEPIFRLIWLSRIVKQQVDIIINYIDIVTYSVSLRTQTYFRLSLGSAGNKPSFAGLYKVSLLRSLFFFLLRRRLVQSWGHSTSSITML